MRHLIVCASAVLGLLVSSAGGAQPGSPEEALRACASLEDDGARLECFDRAAKGLEAEGPPVRPTSDHPVDPELAQVAETMGAKVVRGWVFQEATDPLDGTRSLIAMRPGEPVAGAVPGEGGRSQLLIGCVQVRRTRKEIRESPEAGEHRFVTRLGIGWSEYLGSDSYTEVTYSLDGGAEQELSMYADGQSTVVSGPAATRLLRRLLGADRFAIGVRPYEDPAEIGAVFELSGMIPVVAPLSELCDW